MVSITFLNVCNNGKNICRFFKILTQVERELSKWKGTRLLSPNGEYTTFLTSCETD